MIKHYCDSCKAEIEERVTEIKTDLCTREGITSWTQTFELCDNCAIKALDMLKLPWEDKE